MPGYTPPLEDMDFVLNHIADLPSIATLDGFQHADPDTVRQLLAEAGRFFSEVIAPLNGPGDRQGSTLADGVVTTPDGFPEAYRRYVESGWAGAAVEEEWGGGGMPYAVGVALQEMFKSANIAFSLAPLLTQAAIEALIRHGSEEQQATYLEKLVTGEWTGTMCLTEPHAGSDVGALSTRAVRQEDGTYRLTGQKIFITWGDHDLTDNVIHLVLGRTPGAPPGTKGISMFLVPKYLPDGEGGLGARNDIEIVSLEEKLGIHASPTCVVAFGPNEGAVGYLVGEEERGMRYMFTMMNTARIGVGVEGLSIAQRALEKAADYARERRQGRAIGADPDESSPIVSHPDVRRMLLTMQASTEAMRCLLYLIGAEADHERRGADAQARARAAERVAILTPVVKAWCTDLGVDVTSLGIQVHGGMGYVEETGAAQFFRDARISPIYEGTNGIQAIDLVLRKLPIREGAAVRELLEEMGRSVPALAAVDGMEGASTAVADGVRLLGEATAWLGERLAEGAYDDALAGATPYLEMFGTVAGGWLMGRSAVEASRMLEDGTGDPDFLRAKLTTARFYCEQLLPRAAGLRSSVTAGSSVLYDIEPDRLGR